MDDIKKEGSNLENFNKKVYGQSLNSKFGMHIGQEIYGL